MRPFDLRKEAHDLPKKHLRQGSYLYRFGDPCDKNIYVVVEGTMVQVDQTEAFCPGSEAGPGAIIGDIEVMSDCPQRLESWKAKSVDVRLAYLDKRAATLMGSMYPEFFLLLLKRSIDNLNIAERKLVEKGKVL